MKIPTASIAAIVLLGTCLAANAESTIVEVWDCKLDEGKTIEDVHTANAKWLAFVNGKVEGEVTSHVGESVVGKQGGFLYVDSFPDLATWGAVKAALESPEGEALEEELDGTATCTNNRLYEMTPS